MPSEAPRSVKTGNPVRMKRLALGLLFAAAALYAVAAWLQPRHPVAGYVAAFCEAAMVGAIADWFAVVALFRHPLGLPIPHTAIISTHKDRIGENLAGFICTHFLGTPQVLAKIEGFGAGARLANWLADPMHSAQAAAQLGAALRHALVAFDDERLRHFFHAAVTEQLGRLNAARLSGVVLEALTREGRHRRVIDGLLRRLAHLLDDAALKARVADVIANEVKLLRYVALDNVAGRYAAAKLAAGLTRLVGEMADAPEHPLRLEFDATLASFAARLKDDPDLGAEFAALQRHLLTSPTLAAYLHGLWDELLAWLRHDLDRPDSLMRERTAAAIRHAGEQLRSDLKMQAWIDEQLLAAAPRWIERYREDIRRYIVARVAAWDAGEMTRELERHIGHDLQFIRINGTLVGGLVGLVIYAITQLLRHA